MAPGHKYVGILEVLGHELALGLCVRIYRVGPGQLYLGPLTCNGLQVADGLHIVLLHGHGHLGSVVLEVLVERHVNHHLQVVVRVEHCGREGEGHLGSTQVVRIKVSIAVLGLYQFVVVVQAHLVVGSCSHAGTHVGHGSNHVATLVHLDVLRSGHLYHQVVLVYVIHTPEVEGCIGRLIGLEAGGDDDVAVADEVGQVNVECAPSVLTGEGLVVNCLEHNRGFALLLSVNLDDEFGIVAYECVVVEDEVRVHVTLQSDLASVPIECTSLAGLDDNAPADTL